MAGNIKVLFIGAHNDDCEYGAGGAAVLLKDRGCETVFLNVACTRHADFDAETLAKMNRQETDAAEALGASKIITGDRSRETYFYTQKNVDIIEEQLHQIKADIVFMHWQRDNHIEHVSTAKCTLDALCLADVHGYAPRETYAFEAGPNQTSAYFNPDFYIDIDGAMERVKKSLLIFNQHHANGEGLWREKEVAARFRGHLAHRTWAEAFKIMKYPYGYDDCELLLPKLLKGSFCWAGGGMYPYGRRYYLMPAE
ncbi:MAG TPA: PIG-L family deacetylase [Clostridiales bacterium]|nr:MAG: GlcNAc-PI de-N-acetylase [Firmicutes bacterium ADurb.Bin262]HOU11188.1 PIG-L family deacetylase [Clostridiales bacterium]HQK74331.1 PIG-L family deacetylase [Clostridiales bacterium]